MRFRIKLLSGNNIILVEADNYEAEIFMPCIVRGRINFMNIVPERRCCTQNGAGGGKGVDSQGYTTIACPCQSCGTDDGKNVGFADGDDADDNESVGGKRKSSSSGKKEKQPKGCRGSDGKHFKCTSMPRAGRFAGGTENENKNTQLVASNNSSPAVVSRNLVVTLKRKAEISKSSSKKGESTLATPELPRRAAPLRDEVIADASLFKHRRAVKLRALYPTTPEGAPRRSYRAIAGSTGGNVTQGELQNVSPMTDISNSIGKVLAQSNRIFSSTPINKRLDGGLTSSSPMTRITSSTPISKLPSSAPDNKRLNDGNQEPANKWRKCLTPRVTYSRRGDHAKAVHDKTFSPTRMPMRPPTFLSNPTVPPKPAHKVEMKKRRLKVDDHVRIPIRVIKKRHLKNKGLAVTTSNLEYIKGSIKQLKTSPMSAFDMLTNSNKSRCISNKLNQQFRKGCVNKASSTHAKYKMLSNVPPLKEDIQIHELSDKLEECLSKKPVEQTEKHKNKDQAIATSHLVNKATSTMPLIENRKKSGGVIFYRPSLECYRIK